MNKDLTNKDPNESVKKVEKAINDICKEKGKGLNLRALKVLEKEKNLSKAEVESMIAEHVEEECRRFLSNYSDVRVRIEKANFVVTAIKTVASMVFDEASQIAYSAAKKIESGCNVGDKIRVTLDPEVYGAIATSASKQILTKRIHEHDLVEAISTICGEKNINPEVILDALEAALTAAYKKNFNSYENVNVTIDRGNGKVVVMARKQVVEEVYDDQEEISLEDARKIGAEYNYGDIVSVEVTPKDFGRIAAMTAKQVVTQRIREAERGIIYSEYNGKKDEIVSGVVTRIDPSGVYIDLGDTEVLLSNKEQPKGEVYEIGQRLRCFISNVKNDTKSTQVIISRTHPNLVKRLFELEVPEITEGIVKIMGVSREAGSRTKIAVYSEDPNVDAQGACIGPKGTRVQNIGDELRNEKIDIVKWSEDPAEFISASLSPSKVLSVELDEAKKSAKVVVPEQQLSLAIGKSGQNVRLAAKLTGWKIDISSAAE